MRTRTKGIQVADDGGKVVNKQYRGRRIFTRLGSISPDEAESWLRGKSQAESTRNLNQALSACSAMQRRNTS